MLALTEISRQIDLLNSGNSVDAFEDWFRTASRSMFGESKDVLHACIAIEQVFSEWHSGEMSRDDLLRELAAAVRSSGRIVWKESGLEALQPIVLGTGANVANSLEHEDSPPLWYPRSTARPAFETK